jgi:hypothetical protein
MEISKTVTSDSQNIHDITMPSVTLKRGRPDGKRARDGPKRKKSKRQTEYHSSSSEDEEDGNIPHSERASDIPLQIEQLEMTSNFDAEDEVEEQLEEEENSAEEPGEEEVEEQTEGSGSESDLQSDASMSSTESGHDGRKTKRNDPTAFATSMSKILSAKLSTSKRADPVLSRSKDASAAVKEMSDARLEAKAKQKIKEQKLSRLDNGRISDVLGLDDPEVSTEQILEQERKLKKVAQRGVVKLFNAVRAAQVKGEEAAREARKIGVVGIDKREERVTEMSKKGFLDLIAGGGK